MFCARCGKEIDNDSTFCPFCGQKTDEPVESGGGIPKPKTGSAKKSGRKVIEGIAAVAVVVLIIFGISRLIGGIRNRGQSLPEKLFAMSWEEFSELSENDFKDMLDEAGTLYSVESAEDSALKMKSIETKTTDSFMGGDCLYMYAPESLLAMLYEIRYETEKDFKAGREQIEEILEKSLLKNTVAFETTLGGLKMDWYPVGVSDKNLDVNLDTTAGLLTSYGIDVDELDDEELDKLGQCYIYKLVGVTFGSYSDMSGDTDEFVFPGDKSYTNNMSVITTMYVPMSEEMLVSWLSTVGGYDAISGKKIDPDRFKDSVDEKLVAMYLDEKTASDDLERRRELREELYIRLYMMEEHKLDTDKCIYLKTDDEKRLWYIRNFNWDTDTGAQVDLSDYRDSGSIYCAVECNYNSDTSEYFESELDRALYLADKDYKADTGERFENTEEKRLWFMRNYSYDISSEKVMDKEVVDALIAYQKYIDEDRLNPYPEYGELEITGYTLVYIDDDIVPECVILSDNGIFIMSYKNGEIQSVAPEEHYTLEVSVWYTPQSGTFAIDSWYGNHEREWDVIELKDSFKKTSVLDRVNDYENGIVYTLNGQVISTGGDDDSYGDHYLDEFNFEEEALHATPAIDDEYRNVYDSLLAAYDALRTTIYETYEYCIYEYELKDGILTVKTDDGAAVADGFGTCQPFEFSYPVADDCIWEAGNGFGEYRTEYTYSMTPEELEVEIKNWRNQYELTPDNLESPVAIQFHVIDEQVVGVYTSRP